MPFTDPPTGDAALDGTYYIDYLSGLTTIPPNPKWTEYPYICTYAENQSADDTVGGVGNCSWEWTYSALDVEGNPILTGKEFIVPWESWFRLRYGATVILAGPVVGLKAALGSEVMQVAGQSWEAYFPRWQYPFNPDPDHVNDYRFDNAFIGDEDHASGNPTPTGLVYQAYQRDIALIAHDLLVKIRDSVDDRMYFNFTKFLNKVGIQTNFQYTLGDDSGIDSTLTSLAGVGEGFDWWIGHDRHARIGNPYRYGSPLSPSPVFFLNADTPGLISLEWDDAGRTASHVLGRGAGLASQTQMGAAYGDRSSQEVLTRLDTSFDYGDVRNQQQLRDFTQKSLSVAIHPVRTVTAVMDPRQISGFWRMFRRGVCIFITVDLKFHNINGPFRLKSWSLADENNTGNELVTLTLDRIWPVHANIGDPTL